MDKKQVVTRYAPSPTGYMHIGNLRTALYSYLIAKRNGGKFILRIEDTDRERYVEGAEQVIYDTLRTAGINYDEGPDIGGENGPYIQSQRLDIYQSYAKQLVSEGKAYYCFCSKEDLEKANQDEQAKGYNRHCRNLSQEEVAKNLAEGKPYVIRYKAKLDGTTTFYDHVFGEITVNNDTLQDIVLIKSDGYPTYNFAHIVDDNLMGVTHVARGNEFIIGTPLYVQIYNDFGWKVPEYYHLPLIMGKNAEGEVSKLSKRHGSVSFADLVEQGYLPEAIVNFIALLGWHPKDSDEEIFSLAELEKVFNPDDIRKSSAIFDYDKLKWLNSKYIEKMPLAEFKKLALPYINKVLTHPLFDIDKLCEILQPRVQILSEIMEKIAFFESMPDFDLNLLANPKKKTTLDNSKQILNLAIDVLQNVAETDWSNDNLFSILEQIAEQNELKNMAVMWVVRLAISGSPVTVGGATEIMHILGKNESITRLQNTLAKLNEFTQ